MAEAIILPVAKSILKNIASFIGGYVKEEINGFKSFKGDLKAIADDLECIVSVLHDAEAKQYTNAAMKIWLRDLKSVVYDIDDLLDEVATDAKQKIVIQGHLLPKLRYYLSLKPLILRIDLSRKIKQLRLELKRIVLKKTNFGLTERPVEAPSVERDALDACCYVNKLTILGRDEAKNDLLNRISGLGNESSLSVLPIIGTGGIGKTALAKLVYNDIGQFDIKLWACISDKFNIQNILQNILKNATRVDTSNYSLGALVERLRDMLNGRKFFLVLDDMWEEDIRLWIELKNIYTCSWREGKCDFNHHKDRKDKLPDSVCWRIFKNLAFGENEEERYPRLTDIGMSIVKRCCGIPLVVRCLGSLLRSERDEGEWHRINDMDNLNQLDGQYDTVKQLLKLSFDKLPSHLKSCFAHLSLYAKDVVYYPSYHSYCWSALGLLQLPNDGFLRNNFFNELLSRSMLQDAMIDFTNTVYEVKIHDRLHDLAEDILGEELVMVTKDKFSASDTSRYVVWGSDLADKAFLEQVKAKKARAFISYFRMKNVNPSFQGGIISGMPCLRVLDFKGSRFEELSSSIGNLKHLRFLDLGGNGLLKSLPDTLCELLNLECLYLDGCDQLEELPSKMYKLISLRFLTFTTRQRSLVGTKLNRLRCLRHMSVILCKQLQYIWDSDDIGHLTSLRSLWIEHCPKLKSFPNSMKQLVGLEDLRIKDCKELDLQRGVGLNDLYNLKSLSIRVVPRLSRLPNGIRAAASSLKYLRISECRVLAELPDWLQSFTSLQNLSILNCPSLSSLPEGIHHLNSLQYLLIENCPRLYGIPFDLIQHVPEIWVDRCRVNHLNSQH